VQRQAYIKQQQEAEQKEKDAKKFAKGKVHRTIAENKV